MLVGYARVSSDSQKEDRQLAIFEQAGVERYFLDKASGKNTDRPEYHAMMAFVREGDTLIVESISRLARSTRDLLNTVQALSSKGVSFISQKEKIDTTSPQGRFMLTVFAAMAELERENILQRQAEGIRLAKARGCYKGRKPIATDWDVFKQTYSKWKSGKITARGAMKELGLSANTFYRRVKQYEENYKQYFY